MITMEDDFTTYGPCIQPRCRIPKRVLPANTTIVGYIHLSDTHGIRYEIFKNMNEYYFMLDGSKHDINLSKEYYGKVLTIVLIHINEKYDKNKKVLEHITINNQKIKNTGIVVYNPILNNHAPFDLKYL
jgi:hypothetical protein